ncbi:MAG: tRNA (adenine(22)-N(1))-methyltransferase [Dethiobacteria bacterium]|nr:SAM-dependent methyltransferase [Bacillota bacterium]
MKLKPRLATVASFVTPGSIVADIGTDHAYLSIYLISNNISPRVIAVEKQRGPFKKAVDVVRLFNLEHKIDLRLGDGLTALKSSDQVDVVVIAGVGGRTLCRILIAGKERLKKVKKLILQPMSEVFIVRRWLISNGFRLVAERLADEEGHFYEVLVAERGHQVITDPFLLEVGPKLVENRDPLLIPLLKTRINRCYLILKSLACSKRKESLRQRKAYFEVKIEKLQEVLDYVGQGREDN